MDVGLAPSRQAPDDPAGDGPPDVLVGGAALSAVRFRRQPEHRDRYLGNILIAVGALLPGIGGTMTRAGYVEALYVTELVGLLSIYAGYRLCVRAPAPVAAAPLEQSVDAA